MTMLFVIIPSRASEFLGEKICRLCAVIIGKPSGFEVKRILGNGDLWITEYTITYQGRLAYTVSIMEFRNGKVVDETVFRGSLRGASMAEAMGSAERLTPH